MRLLAFHNRDASGRVLATALVALCMTLSGFIKDAGACAFDLTKPERTAVDWILEAETLVLARPDPGNAFSYEVVEVLLGDPGQATVPFLVNSLYRKTLANNVDHTVLFRKTATGSWAQVAYVDQEFLSLLQTVLSKKQEWSGAFPASRFAAFEALQSSASPRLRELAIRELDKASYAQLRTLDLKIPVEDLLSDLWSARGYPYQPVRVLLLGLSDDSRARAEVYDYFARVRDWDWANNIGAFAAALVELDGFAGVEHLEDALLSDPTQPLEKVQGLVTALAIQRGLSAPDVGLAIDGALARTVVTRPEIAGVVAREFTLVADWSQADVLAQLLQSTTRIATADLILVSVYLSQARSTAQGTVNALEKG